VAIIRSCPTSVVPSDSSVIRRSSINAEALGIACGLDGEQLIGSVETQ
jgi:hypothetical protein